jgi:predicted branched-subunit amino acid permease
MNLVQFKNGFRAVLPIFPGIIPFGAVMGSAFAEARLSFWQAMLMNTSTYAGASQLAATDLMKLNAAMLVVVTTGLIINLRFLLYSAAMAPLLKESGPLVKFICAFTLTDQSYAAMTVNQSKFQNNAEAVDFYLGTAASMLMIWHLSVICGYAFGNFAPRSLSLDFAIPLSFVALLMPTLKRKGHKVVALFSSVLSLFFYGLPLRTGLILTALVSIGLAWFIIKQRSKHD